LRTASLETYDEDRSAGREIAGNERSENPMPKAKEFTVTIEDKPGALGSASSLWQGAE
jgi:hypothetical protein